MNYVRLKSYAKINLTLDVLGKEGGYHLIDSVVATVDLCDVIAIKRRKDKLINIDMHGFGSENIPFEKNNAVIAAERFSDKFSTDGADITVWKNIPVGAGLGGSSADVAGVLRGLSKLYGVDDFAAVKDIADGIGSDCGYMLTGGFARLGGRGEKVEKLGGGLKLDIGILLPKSGVSTASCYALCDKLKGNEFTSAAAQEAIEAGDKFALGKSLSNGLFPAARSLNPEISEAYGQLAAFAPLGVNMSGSGSAVYAIFENDQFLSYAKSRYDGRFNFIQTKTIVGEYNG
ncbi:MAG: 4-(cytidine 5'-diphospho)-2-C-methyl-D-erythritol kinase [Clostridia bacterium]|nr:4-(cytidine 5'-diphospho)-2-C-methyl-D-erythritol kinase [Clostridia bacterium]